MELMTKNWPPADRPLKELVDDYKAEHYYATGVKNPPIEDHIIIVATAIYDLVSRWIAEKVICPIKGHDPVDTSPLNCGKTGAFELTCRRCGWSRSGHW